MTILDRYILKNYILNFVFLFFCILGIYIVFDLFTNLDRLLNAGKAHGNVGEVIATYYFFKTVPIAMMLSSILGLLAAMITVAMMMRHNELIPIQAAGISTIRIISPLIVAFILIAVGSTALREMVLPNYLDELVMDADSFREDEGSMVNATIDHSTGITIQGDRIFRSDRRISKPNFVLHRPVVKRPTNLRAVDAFYHPARDGRPAGFMLESLTEKQDVLDAPAIEYNGKKIVITHHGEPEWIKPGDCFVISGIPFDYLASNDAWRQYASTRDLIHAVRNRSMDTGNRIRASIHGRLMEPFLDITLLFLGLPIILSNGDRNVFKAMGISGLLVLAFLVVRRACLYLGASGEMPILGAWLPMMIFAPIAVNQFLMLREK